MMRFLAVVSMLLGLSACTSSSLPPGATPTLAQLLAPAAAPQLVSRQFSFTEGPAADSLGNVFFTDQPNNRIWKYSTQGQLSLFLEPAGRANGLYFDEAGQLLACADERNQLWAIAPNGQVKVLLADVQGHTFNGPNDLWVRPGRRGIYFTDPYYQRPYWSRQAPDSALRGQHVYFLPPNQRQPVVADANLQQPNGIVGSADGKLLYVADIGANKTYRYQIAADGRLLNRQLFVAQGSDGMTLDAQGNVYLTGEGVTVYSPQGQLLGNIPVPEKWTANVCFGGADRKTLFITASEGLYVLPMRVSGSR